MNQAIAAPSPTPSPSCNDVIHACDKALDDKNKEIKLADLAIQQAKTDNTRLNKEVEEKDAKLGSIFRNPVVLVALGLVGGLFLRSLLK